MSIPQSDHALSQARHIVVKLGTQLLTGTDGRLDAAFIRRIAKQITQLRNRGILVTVVSSGAIGAGCGELKLNKRPADVATLQAIASIGQRKLMTLMHSAFNKLEFEVGQILLTRTDVDDRTRYLNIRNCITRLHELKCVPIVNENDTVAVDEIRFGDNDMLAALICNALRADALILLSVVDGLLDEQGNVLPLVENAADAFLHARQEKTSMGSGGMTSKLEAARLVTDAGETAIIANGREKAILLRLFDGEKLGTHFVPSDRKLASRQRWIGLTVRPAGTVSVDAGAAAALVNAGKSLLASGITATTGQFTRGDVLMVRDEKGIEIARGLSNYNADELRLILGKRSNQFEKILGRKAYAEVIHRNHMVLMR